MEEVFILYKLPGNNPTVKRKGLINNNLENVVDNKTNDELFYFSPFNAGNKAYTCVLNETIENIYTAYYSHDRENTYDTEEQFTHKVRVAVNQMNQHHEMSKVVLARCKKIKTEKEFDINSCFLALCRKYPTAFVYAISSPVTGTWLAATPELLLKSNDEIMETTALAGTMLANKEQPWTNKEIDEQHQVEVFIEEIIEKHHLKLITKTGPQNLVAGHIKHIQTNYEFLKSNNLSSFLQSLNPTPAVAGLPKIPAINFIEQNENLNRSFYAGFVGTHFSNQLSLFVNLRCMEVFKNHVNVYAGCGITKNSIPQNEWIETENKMLVISQIIHE